MTTASSSPREAPPEVEGSLRQRGLLLLEYAWVVLDNHRLIFSVCSATMLLALLYSIFTPPRFRSDVVVQVEERTKVIAGLEDLLTEKSQSETEMEILRSRYLLGSVVDELNLTTAVTVSDSSVLGSIARLAPRRWRGADARETLAIAHLAIPAELVGRRCVLSVDSEDRYRLLGPDGSLLAEGAVGAPAEGRHGAVAILVTRLAAPPGTRFWVTTRDRSTVIADLRRRLRIEERGKKTGIIEVSLVGTDPGETARTLDTLGATYVRQNVERESAQAAKTLAFIEDKLPSLHRALTESEERLNSYLQTKRAADMSKQTQALIERSATLERMLSENELNASELRQRFAGTHPSVISLQEKRAKLQAELASVNQRIEQLPKQELETARLQREVNVSKELYLLLTNRVQELQVVKSGTVGNVRVLDAAYVPRLPIGLGPPALTLLAGFLGLGAGVAMVIVWRAVRKPVDDPSEVEARAGVPVLATIPHSSRERRQWSRPQPPAPAGMRLLALGDPTDPAIESLRSLHTAIEIALAEVGSKVLAVTGAAPGVGKSFVSANLACVMAASGSRVLLVDGDLRNGRLAELFGLPGEKGLHEALAARAPLSTYWQGTAVTGLGVLPAGKLTNRSTEVIRSSRFRGAVEAVGEGFDVIVVDTPPLLATTDATIIGRSATCVLVARSGVDVLDAITHSITLMSRGGARVVGVVMNDVRAGFGKYSRYGHRYRYPYGPANSQETRVAAPLVDVRAARE